MLRAVRPIARLHPKITSSPPKIIRPAVLRNSSTSLLPRNTSSNDAKRSYFFGSIEPKNKIPGRVSKNAKKFSLETFEPHYKFVRALTKPDRLFIGCPEVSSYDKLISGIFWKWKENTWGERFSFNGNEIVPSTLVFDSSELLDIAMRTSGFRNPDDDYANYLKSDDFFEIPYTPDLLYSISQEAWEEFIKLLPDQDVAARLNLFHHRHLWPAYNYAVKTEDASIRKNRATYLGEFHFFLSFIEMKKNYGAQIQANISQILNRIDKNDSPMDIFSERCPPLTRLLINKFAHCPSWVDMHRIGEAFVLKKAMDAKGHVNLQKLQEFTAALPSSKKDPRAFSEMMEVYRKLFVISPYAFSPNGDMPVNLFYHQRNTFGLFKSVDFNLSQLKDYINSITNNLVYPEFIRQILRHENAAMLVEKFSGKVNNINEITSSRLTELYSAKMLTALEQRWHRNFATINNLKPKPLIEKGWYPLFNPITIGCVTFTCLTNNNELKHEGNTLQHCVGGYSVFCLRGETHIVSAVSTSGQRSTLELKSMNKLTSRESFRLLQNQSQRNAAPSKEIDHASTQLISMINRGNIKLNSRRGEIAKRDNTLQTEGLLNITNPAYNVYPYMFNDPDTQEKIYQAHKKTQTLPPALTADTYDKAMRKSGLTNLIEEEIQNLAASLPTHHMA